MGGTFVLPNSFSERAKVLVVTWPKVSSNTPILPPPLGLTADQKIWRTIMNQVNNMPVCKSYLPSIYIFTRW